MAQPLATGKLPAGLLASLLARLPRTDPRVVLGPGIGQDAAVLDMGDRYLVAKTDPITFATEEIGAYAVNVNANDVACMGARPQWYMASVLLPAGRADAALAESLFEQIRSACAGLNVALIGGHTEVTHDLARPIVVGAMLGEVAKDKLVTSRGARVGDIVLLTKAVPLEGTALIAREKAEDLHALGFSSELIERARDLLHQPGISVVREALLAADAGLATAMHDPTEGGLATGLAELAQAAGAGLRIDERAIPLLKEGLDLCAAYHLDPLGVIASGSLLITARRDRANELVKLIEGSGIQCAAIGELIPAEQGLTLSRGELRRPLPRFPADEIAKLF